MLGAVYKSKHPPHLPFFSSLPLICALMCPFVNTTFPLLYLPICSVHICPLKLFYIPFSLLYPHILNICTHICASHISGHILIFPSPAPLPLLISSNILIFLTMSPKRGSNIFSHLLLLSPPLHLLLLLQPVAHKLLQDKSVVLLGK